MAHFHRIQQPLNRRNYSAARTSNLARMQLGFDTAGRKSILPQWGSIRGVGTCNA